MCEDFLFLVNFHVVFPTSGKGLLKIRIFPPNNASFSTAFPDPLIWHVACSPPHLDGATSCRISPQKMFISRKKGEIMRAQKLHTARSHKPFQHPTHVELADTVGAGRPELLPDAVLPEQFYGPPRGASRTQSEFALMRAVLDDAITCYQKQFVTNTQRERRLAKEAEAWFFDNDERWPFSLASRGGFLSTLSAQIEEVRT